MKLYNTLTRKTQDFQPQDPKNVKIYTCGPTVYARAHIGNLTSYVYWDLLVRLLQSKGYSVNRVLNLTDVGHLTSDADDGEDKLEKGAKKENKTVWDVAEKYIGLFLEDFESLHLVSPTKIARATDYIARDIAFIDRLTERGYTYETNDGVYFDTAKFPAYRDFARLDLDHLRAGARVSFSSEKRNVSDFALWKFIQPGEDHAMRWDYLGRPGYPGWHIECSVISHEELGEPLDIHTGGIDHIPVHHTNEIAQSEAAYDLELAKFWLHCNFITIDGQKISKSLGNTYTLDDLAEKGFTPLDFKMWVLQGHYQGERNFSFEDLMAAKNRLLGWRNRIALLYQGVGAETSGGIEEILKALNDNLNSAKAFALIDNTALTMDEWRKLDEIFGLELINSTPDITEEQRGLMLKREVARKEKDYTTADKIRAELERGGVTVLDSADGSVWQYL